MSAERLRPPEWLIGKEAKEVILEILRLNPQIAKISFSEYDYIPRVFDREGQKFAKVLTREEVLLTRGIDHLISQLEPGFDLAVRSKVELENGSSFHIPMMDFCLPLQGANLKEIKRKLRETVGENSGWILDSGRSYHFYGLNLRSENEWREFMGSCLLCNEWLPDGSFYQMTETRYVGYKLIAGFCSLRLSNNVGKKKITVVVDVL